MHNPYPQLFPEGASLRRSMIEGLARDHRFYLMLIVPRSGSTWLTDLARHSGVLGCPQEWLNPDFCAGKERHLDCPPPSELGTREINAYLDRAMRLSAAANGVAGLQVSAREVEALAPLAASDFRLADFLSASFLVRRRDLAAQAVSLYRSSRSGRFHSYQDGQDLRARFDAVPYDGEAIRNLLNHIVDCEIRLIAFCRRCGLAPAELIYEDYVQCPEKALRLMAERLQVPPSDLPAPVSVLTRMSDMRSADMIDRFHAEYGGFLAEAAGRRPPWSSDRLNS